MWGVITPTQCDLDFGAGRPGRWTDACPRLYTAEPVPDILDGTCEARKVFDITTGLDGYHDITDRTSPKVLVRP